MIMQFTMAVVIVALAGLAGSFLVPGSTDRRRTAAMATSHDPLHEAERILAERYASGQLSRDAYESTLSILRR